MYNLPHFRTQSPARLLEFMRANPFTMMIGVGEDRLPVATQVPVFTDERDGSIYLSGHIMRKTDHHRAFLDNPDALFVFSGPHTYISARWYADPHQASTWNYMSVHARGRVHFKDEEALLKILERTTNHFEQNPDAFHAMTPEYVSRLTGAIVAFEVEVESLDHVFKLSQNKDAQTFQQILAKLDQGTAMDRKVAEEMRKEKS
jgi:transcriptional regulator